MDELLQIPSQVNQLLYNFYNNPNPSIGQQIDDLIIRYAELGGRILINGDTVTYIFPYNQEFDNIDFDNIDLENFDNIDTCECGCHEKVNIDKLMNMRYNKKNANIIKSDVCTICLDCFKSNNILYGLNCDHFFHKKCIVRWFRENVNCPTCRKDQETL